MRSCLSLLLLVPAVLSVVSASTMGTRTSTTLNVPAKFNNATTVQRRQTSSKDILKRLRDGPRRRQGASPEVCTQVAGENQFTNGGFQQSGSGNSYPSYWSVYVTGPSAAYATSSIIGLCQNGETECDGYGYQAQSGPGSLTLRTSTQVCSSRPYTFTYAIGERTNGWSINCDVTASITHDSTGTTQTFTTFQEPCANSVSCTDNGQGFRYHTFSQVLQPFTSAGSVTAKFLFDCPRVSSGTASWYYTIDAVSLTL